MRTHRILNSVISLCLLLVWSVAIAAASQDCVELTWFMNRTAMELPYWQEMADRFMERNEQFRVEVMNDSGYVTKLTTMIAGGMAPDIVRGETNWMPDFAAKGWLVDLEPYVTRERTELKLHEIPKPVLEALVFAGCRYALPQVVSSISYHYNLDMYEEAGMSGPPANWVWDDLLKVSRKLTCADSTGAITRYGLSIGTSLHHDVYAFILQNEGDLYTPDRKEILIDSPQTVEAIDYAQALVNQHKVAAWSLNFPQRKTAAFVIGPWQRGSLNTVEGLRWDVALLPKQKRAVAPLYVGGLGILTDSKNREESWQLIKYLLSTEAQHIWAKNGQSCPARLPVAGSLSFLSAGAPANAMAYVEAINLGVPEPSLPGWMEIRGAMDRALRPVFLGQLAARVGAEQAKAIAQPMLDEINKTLCK